MILDVKDDTIKARVHEEDMRSFDDNLQIGAVCGLEYLLASLRLPCRFLCDSICQVRLAMRLFSLSYGCRCESSGEDHVDNSHDYASQGYQGTEGATVRADPSPKLAPQCLISSLGTYFRLLL